MLTVAIFACENNVERKMPCIKHDIANNEKNTINSVMLVFGSIRPYWNILEIGFNEIS